MHRVRGAVAQPNEGGVAVAGLDKPFVAAGPHGDGVGYPHAITPRTTTSTAPPSIVSLG